MAEPQASRFWIAAQQSGLLDIQRLTACWDAIPREKRDALEHLDRRLARQAVQQSFLTLWQAQQLLAGRTIGFRVDRYLLLELIGQGGMGRVYLARDTRLNRRVALKILAPERMNNARAVERFKREARVGAQLQHENLVRIYDFGHANGRFYLVMEYIEGKTIGALITAQGPMPVPTAARLAWQIALGLEHAHRKGLIHRDVNPYNILVTHEGIAKLADLGLAKDLADDEHVTREGATVGTFDYVAPEQARNSQLADIRSDIYSLGCTLYHMITGRVPFPSPSLTEKLFAHQVLEPTPLNQLIPSVPGDLVGVVQRMMRKLPDERYATPLLVAQALEQSMDESPKTRDGESTLVHLVIDEAAAYPAVLPPDLSEVQANSAPQALGLQPQPAPNSASSVPVAVTVRGSTSPLPGLELGRDQSALAPSLLTPISENDASSSTEDVPLILDTGPEPSLTDSLSRPKSWFGFDKPAQTQYTAASRSPSRIPLADRLRTLRSLQGHPWFWWLGATAIALAFLVVGYVLARWRGKDSETSQPRNQEAGRMLARTPQGRQAPRPGNGTTGASKEIADLKGKSAPAITILTDDGEERPGDDLFQAMETAIGAKGWVILHGSKPLSLSARQQPINLSGAGWLKLRAAQGAKPVLIIELKGQKPFLTVGPSVQVILAGLTVKARYLDFPPGNSTPAPIILAGGPTQLRYCAFEVVNGTKVNGTCALVADGNNLKIENCLFKGFQTALEVHAIGGSTTLVKQTMIVPARGDVARSGCWGVRMQFMGGNLRGSARWLILDHCTVAGSGLLQLAGFSLQSPLQVKATGCAVQTEALVDWEVITPETPPNLQALQWNGEGNQLDVSGATWVVASAKGVHQPVTNAVDRHGWLRIATEVKPVIGSIKFSSKPEARLESLAPGDYAIEETVPGKVGASPEQVGPGAAVLDHSAWQFSRDSLMQDRIAR